MDTPLTADIAAAPYRQSTDKEAAGLAASPLVASPAAAPRPVLLVEDDPLVLMATSDTLAGFGLPVAEAATASEAKERLHALDEKGFGAAIVDIGLPDLAGTDLVGEIRALCPALPIIVASGYDRKVLETHFGDDASVHYLQKPYAVAALEALLRRLGVLLP